MDDISLDIEEGEFFSMLGPSGCGKTTTLRMIGGFEEPSLGTVYLGGRDVTDLPPVQARREHRVPVLRVVPPSRRLRERRLRPAAQEGPQGRDREPRQGSHELVDLKGFETRKPREMSGRSAAAGGPRPRPGEPSEGAPARRAARRARPQAPQADAAGAEDDPARGRHHVHLRDARPGRGDDDVGPPRGDATRQDRAAGRARAGLREPCHRVRRRVPGRLEPARRRDHGENGMATVRLTTGETIELPAQRVPSGVDKTVRIGVRPEKISITSADVEAPDGTNSVTGLLRISTYIGVSHQYKIEVPGAHGAHRLRAEPGRRPPPAPGEKVRLSWLPSTRSRSSRRQQRSRNGGRGMTRRAASIRAVARV